MGRLGQAAGWLGGKLWSWTAHSLTLENLEPPALQRLLGLWHATRDDDGTPWLARFDPKQLDTEVRQIALVDVSAGVADARYRLVGSALSRLYGRDLTGKLVRECYSGSVLREVQEAYARVVAERWPLYSTREFQLFGRSFGYRRLLLPLSRTGEEVSHVVLGLYPASPALTDASQWRPYEQELAAESFRAAQAFTPSVTRDPKPLVRPAEPG